MVERADKYEENPYTYSDGTSGDILGKYAHITFE